MAYICERCKTHEAALATCPSCGQPMKFTLLPPPGQDPTPVADAPTQFQQRYGINPHATRNYAQDHIHSAFWDGLGKTTLLVVLTMIAVGGLLYVVLRGVT